MNIKTYLSNQKAVVERALEQYMLVADGPFAAHFEAMRYSLFAGGKRLRPILCLAAGQAVSGETDNSENLLPIACALECIHTYSLIHDDLPAMDDDDLRRGKATNHVLYGEAGAILAGDGLLTYAFDLLSNERLGNLDAARRLKIINIIARAAGPEGMVGGQALDIASENTSYPFEVLQTIHRNKTGALITGSIQAGAIASHCSEDELRQLTAYGDNVGLAFQIIDDLLDATATTEELGKTAGSDEERGKATYPAYFGIEKTRSLARQAVDRALESLTGFDNQAEPLRALARYIYTRGN
ncbi:polyprenyl synthetase family protein [Desulfosediminicola ganghwensis]|uniref:polyprenyl synthetase family protein n=1 Tax=Desulfosediminicola ganghwensis TaxID=2569540 RepID=UPI0010ABC46A|nr:farnesyl diphosphate synthase [Desulfosediminicola ganghwensis]